MSPRRPEGFWGAIAVTLEIGAALSLPLALILIATVLYTVASYLLDKLFPR